jgi:hypothetical protein
MASYDFKNLSSFEFEDLTRDLLQRELECTLESFAEGRDQGVDLRHSVNSERNLIVQCKHYANSNYSNLESVLRREELPKIARAKPERYILSTSLRLSKKNKDDLFKLLQPHVKTTGDIYGQRDLNNLLGKFPEVERQHFKLWLGSTTVLQAILHSEVFAQSEAHKRRILEHTRLYVQNRSYGVARNLLEEHGYCVIAGNPGIGKTTLADMLVAEYLARGFDFYMIERHVDEVQGLFNDRDKQLFYYDDFLGQTSLVEKLGKKEDQSLLHFIERVQRSKRARMILTTREYILNQAKMVYEPLSRSSFDLWKCVIDLKDYTQRDRAKILFNHLYFSALPGDYKLDILREKNYRRVVSHPNYNPRTIAMMADYSQLVDLSSTQYADEFVRLLDDPRHIWHNAFEHQMHNASRHLLLVLVSLGGAVRLDDLREAWLSFYGFRAERYHFPCDPTDFRRSLKELEGNFIRIGNRGKELCVEFQNPSVRDFLEAYIEDNREDALDLAQSAVFFEQLSGLCNCVWLRPSASENPKTRKEVPSVLWDAMLRTFELRNCRLVGSSHYVSKEPIEAKLRFAVLVASKTSDWNGVTTIREMLERLVQRLENGVGDGAELILLLRECEVASFQYSEMRCLYGEVRGRLLSAAKEVLIRQIDASNDLFRRFDDFVVFNDLFPDVVMEQETARVQELFESMAEEEIRQIIDNDDAYDLDEYGNLVESLGKTLHLDVSRLREDLERAQERKAERGPPDETPDDWQYDRTEEKDTETWIDNLFGALLE